jgi:hypothetical protein
MPEPSPDPAPEQPAASPESYRPGEDNAEARPDARVPLPPAERTQPAAALPPRRDYMAEAKAAQSPQEFDRIRASAVAAGCSDEYADALDRIAAGRRAAARQQRQQAAGPETLPGAPGTVNDRLDAIAALYAAGEAAGLSQVETRDLLAKETGRTLGDATPTHLANVTADLRAAGGAR